MNLVLYEQTLLRIQKRNEVHDVTNHNTRQRGYQIRQVLKRIQRSLPESGGGE